MISSTNKNNESTEEIEIEIDERLKAEIERAIAIINKYNTRPIRAFEFQLRANQQLRAHSDVLWLRALLRDGSKTLLAEIDFCLLDKSNIIAICYGGKGTTKSTVLGSLAYYQWKKSLEFRKMAEDSNDDRYEHFLSFENPMIHLSYSNDETTDFVEQTSKGSIIWQDEIVKQSGEDSKIQEEQVINLEETLREGLISFYFASITLKGYERIANFVLFPLSKNRKHGYNKVLVLSKSDYDGRLIPLFTAIVHVYKDEELKEFYQKRKDEHLQDIKENRGLSVVKLNEKRVRRDLETAMNYANNPDKELQLADIPLRYWKKGWIRTILRLSEIRGSSAYLNRLEDILDIMIKKEKVKFEISLKKPTNETSQEEESLQKEAKDFTEYLRKTIELALLKVGVFANLNEAKRYSLYYFSGFKTTWESVAEELGEKTLSDSVRKFVSARRNKAKVIVARVFETAISYYLNQKIFDVKSSPDYLNQKINFSVGSGKGKCDIVLGSCPGEHLLSINAKLNLGDRSSYQHPISPEYVHCPEQAFVFEWTRSKGLFISKVSEKNFKRGSGEEYSLDLFIEYAKTLIT